jgi:hypothetical protein
VNLRMERFDQVGLMNLASVLLVLVAFLIALFAASVWLVHRPTFNLVSVRVEGIDDQALRHVNVASVRASAMPSIKGNFFTVNLMAVREAFETARCAAALSGFHARILQAWSAPCRGVAVASLLVECSL